MSIADTLSDNLSRFEKYNNKELYHIGSSSIGFTVTGRLVSGVIGFIVIILMLMVTFSSAANSIMISDLGGTKAFTADVVLTETTGPTLEGTLSNEGDFVEFGYIIDDANWNYISELRISYIDVQVVWDANGGGGGGRQVTFDVSTENDTAGQSQNNGGGGGTITITLPVNQLPETVTDTADSAEEFVQSHETLGEWVGGKFTYSSESLGALITSESIDYTISLIYYTWEFDNIREIVEV